MRTGIVLLLLIAPALSALEIPLKNLRVDCPVAEPRVQLALETFETRVVALGGEALPRGDAAASRALRLSLAEGSVLEPAWFAGLKPWQREEAFIIACEGNTSLRLAGGGVMGLVYGLSELSLRLRLREGAVVLSFAEWPDAQHAEVIREAPAIEGRGEYLNVGYDIAGITPHQWDTTRWRAYIDRLLLAKLNRWYFYVWVDSYTIYPESKLSTLPLNTKIHEDLRDTIAYAQSRGLKVTWMISPTFLPRDVWQARPELHAEIEYVDHGFPVACPRAPGAMPLMEAVWRSELEYFRKADSVQIWFYDPGGCWCEKNGCKARQAESLAEQFLRFGRLMREGNPRMGLEFNIWPAWIWEDRMGQRYRGETARRIAEAFSDEVKMITAAGAPDGEASLPLVEQEAGFRTSAFLFATNPESGYAFPIPHLRYTRESIRRAREHGIHDLFTHRLEAWTRFSETLTQGAWLWNPDAPEEQVLQRLGAWMCADEQAGQSVARGYRLLDDFVEEGATSEMGDEIAKRAREAFRLTPAKQRAEMRPWLETCEAMELLGRAAQEKDTDALAGLRGKFEKLMQDSEVFAPLGVPGAPYFERYRVFLQKPWKNGVY